mmetsp:Transcript_22967/g.73508  ORF Transcript_22967/g.73508 Transcript_22967/m.73508 type:complete len:100 (-) Transcript_22967:1038-1337(-)
MPRSHVPAAHFAKGTYFALSGRPSPFRGLVYPLPQQAGLGVHATVDLAGRCRFGPDVEWTSNAEDVQARRGRGPLRILTVAVDVVASSHSRSSTSRSRL